MRSIRKNAAEPTETVKGSGNGRCAHRRINHTRAESRPGRDPADAERFSGSKISAIKFAPLCKCKKCNEFTLSKKRRFVLVNYRKQRNTRNATELPFLEISPKPTTTSAFRSRPRHDGPFVALGVSSTAGRRPETRTCTKPRLGRGLSTTDSFCGLEFRRGAMWALHDGRLWPGISRGPDVGPRLGRAGQDRRAHAPVGPLRRPRWLAL